MAKGKYEYWLTPDGLNNDDLIIENGNEVRFKYDITYIFVG